MAHRTDPFARSDSTRSQADEGLHRAVGDRPTHDGQVLLQRLAKHLRACRPTAFLAIDEWNRLARQHAISLHGYDTQQVDDALRELADHAPAIRPGETRGEYALRLNDAARA